MCVVFSRRFISSTYPIFFQFGTIGMGDGVNFRHNFMILIPAKYVAAQESIIVLWPRVTGFELGCP